MAGAVTPLTTMTPEKQAYYDRVSRLAELNSAVVAMRKTEAQQSQAVETPAATEERGKRIDKQKDRDTKRPVDLSQKPPAQRSIRAINSEKAFVNGQRMRGEITKAEWRTRQDELNEEKIARRNSQ
jgi:Ni/Co efflux regulator RcnB